MHTPNPTIERALIQGLTDFYQISATKHTFVPIGRESYAYKVTTATEETYFVKYSKSDDVLEHIEKVNALLMQLTDLDFIVSPVSVDNITAFPLLGGKMMVYPFIEGQPLDVSNDDFDAETVQQLTHMLVQIHQAQVYAQVPEETFTHGYFELLERLKLSRMEKKYKDVFKENIGKMEDLLQKYSLTMAKYRERPHNFFLTHGDITGANIIRTDKGLKLVDWDGAMYAPIERDLRFLVENKHFSLENYFKLSGQTEYNPELRELYNQQWALDSIIGNFEVLLDTQLSDDDKAECMKEILLYLPHS